MQQVLDQLADIKLQVRDLRTVLMGHGGDGETPYGRIPMVEADVKDLQARMGLVEKANIRRALVLNAAVAVLAAASEWMVQHIAGAMFGK